MSEVTLLLHPNLEDAQVAFIYLEDSNQFLFRGVDAAVSLGYKNPSRSIRQHVNPDWIAEIDDKTAKGNKVLYLTEAGFYELSFSSNLEKAQKFRKWVFDEVLVSIREKGAYIEKVISDEQYKKLQADLDKANSKMAFERHRANLLIQQGYRDNAKNQVDFFEDLAEEMPQLSKKLKTYIETNQRVFEKEDRKLSQMRVDLATHYQTEYLASFGRLPAGGH